MLDALRLSLVDGDAARPRISLVLGVPLAWVLARSSIPGRRLLRALVTAAAGAAAGGRRRRAAAAPSAATGSSGTWLDEAFGITLPFTTAAVVLAETFVAMPFLVIAVEGALRGLDRGYDEAAATLGAGRWLTFRRVTLPLVAPGIVAGRGAVLGARARASSARRSPSPATSRDAPRRCRSAVYLALQNDPDAAIALCLVLLVVSIAVLVLLRGRLVGTVSQ